MYVEWQDTNGYLELKFHPHTGILVEVVLAPAPGIQAEEGNLAPRIDGPVGLMPFLDPGSSRRTGTTCASASAAIPTSGRTRARSSADSRRIRA